MSDLGSPERRSDATHVGDQILRARSEWSFSDGVAKSFDQHVERSIPFYHQGHTYVEQLADFFIHDDSVVYDLGCSTGKLTATLADRSARKRAHFIGLDIEKEMIEVAKQKFSTKENVAFLCEDISAISLQKADLIIAYYTIQFILPRIRQTVIDKIYQALNWGGAFIWFEKIRGSDARFQDIISNVYVEFKLSNGFSPAEIVAKSRSLAGILEPFSSSANKDLLRRAGFVDFMTVFAHAPFEGVLAIK